MVRLNLSLTRREFCATVAGAITESCEKSTVTIQRADLRHPFFSLSSPPLFLSPRSLRPFTSRFPVYRRHVTSGQGRWKKRGDAFIDSVYRFNFTSSLPLTRRQRYRCIYVYERVCRDPSCQICWMDACVYRTGRIVARSFKVFGLRNLLIVYIIDKFD